MPEFGRPILSRPFCKLALGNFLPQHGFDLVTHNFRRFPPPATPDEPARASATTGVHLREEVFSQEKEQPSDSRQKARNTITKAPRYSRVVSSKAS